MASLVTTKTGLRRIEFGLVPNEKRRVIRLGRMNAKAAKSFKARVETIIGDKAAGRPHDPETSGWLAKLDEPTLAKLRDVGLADGVGLAQTTLGMFLERYFKTMSAKPGTRTFYGHTRRNLEAFFTPTRTLRSMSTADADAWRAWLVETEGLSAATVARRVIAARTMWRKALRWKLVADNPFEGVKGGHQSNESRKRFISPETIDDILAEAPDAEWRVVIALARYGGLRTPSETFALKWGDINWERGTVRVTCPKLEHNEHFASRVIPLFPELREPLLALFDAAEAGSEHVIARLRTGCGNLRRHFERIIRRAGYEPWPRLFHNLRASRETELMREYDLATVCKWIGNSPAIAARHYATSIDLDADFQRAAGMGAAQQKAQQSASARRVQDVSVEPPTDEETPENVLPDTSGHLHVSPVISSNWALLDSNQ